MRILACDILEGGDSIILALVDIASCRQQECEDLVIYIPTFATVLVEAMMTRKGRILSITNESKLNSMLLRGYQVQVNLCLKQDPSAESRGREYNPTAKHVLDPMRCMGFPQ